MRLALITGTSRGLGAAIAHAVLERGWHVLGIARSAAGAELTRHERYAHAEADLAHLDALPALVERQLGPRLRDARCERVGLVNNAGLLQPIAPLPHTDAAALARTLLVNVVAPVWLTGWILRAAPALPVRVIDISSGAATQPYPGWTAYCASKAALRMAGMVLGTELAEVPDLMGRDVAVVSYAPHIVATRMQDEIRSTDPESFPRRQRFVELHQSGALVDPAGPAGEVAELLDQDGLPPFSERRFDPGGLTRAPIPFDWVPAPSVPAAGPRRCAPRVLPLGAAAGPGTACSASQSRDAETVWFEEVMIMVRSSSSKTLLTFGAALVLLAAAAAPAWAQCTPVPGSGCPSAGRPGCTGSTSLGKSLTVSCLDNGRAAAILMAVGICIPPLPVNAPVTCAPTGCTFAVEPFTALVLDTQKAPVLLVVPNDPTLLGLTLCLQCAEVSFAPLCTSFAQAVRIQIAP